MNTTPPADIGKLDIAVRCVREQIRRAYGTDILTEVVALLPKRMRGAFGPDQILDWFLDAVRTEYRRLMPCGSRESLA